MRIKIINPNTSIEMSKNIDLIAKMYKRKDTEIVTVSSQIGPSSIDCYYDQAFASIGVLKEVSKSVNEGFHGVIIACFDDPALQASLEYCDIPVVGIGEAAMHLACLVGAKFSVLSMPKSSLNSIQEQVRRYGLEQRCASIRLVDVSVSELENNKQSVKKELLKEGSKAIKEDNAEVIVLGCAGLAGMDKEFQNALHVPVIDGVVAAVKLMEGILDYGIKTSKVLTYRKPATKPLKGFDKLMEDSASV
ncbi:MAG: aspartate/glutamate racemase family protein [Conexivisphaerales archaeon]